MAARVPANLVLVVFAPFAAGYYLSYFYRYINAVIAQDLVRDFGLAPADLGWLTSAYFLSFALFQVPLGVLLDRFGPRRCAAALMCVAGLGALLFGLAQNLATLSAARALIGLGVSAGLMGAIKAFMLWFPRDRQTALTGAMIGIGSIGTLSATAPAEALLGPLGWRALFFGLALLSVAAAAIIFFVLPEREVPGRSESWAEQFSAVGKIYARLDFWRLALPLVVSQGIFQALQGLWFAPWLADVHGFDRRAIADALFVSALAYCVVSLALGRIADTLSRRGISQLRLYQAGMLATAAAFVPLALGVRWGLLVWLVLFAAMSIAAIIAYTLVTQLVPLAQSGRVTTASNVVLFSASFAFQWGVGAVLGLWPASAGRYDPEGYRVAFGMLLAAQAAAAAWLLTAREAKP
ncbi:MAG TPA: MFS transporter [Burkholderiales bacterium]|nr:MFS transporter [Burkholderiales bacterium]